MFGWFKKRPKFPPVPPSEPEDRRVWNEDWRVGDIAECVIGFDDWHPDMPPWNRPKLGDRFTVLGFKDSVSRGKRRYFLKLEGWPVNLSCTAFRKVRPDSKDQSEIVERILKATPGRDVVREPEAI